MKHQRFQGQVALVTGGNAGIGRAIARAFVNEGAKVIVFGTNQERGDEIVKELNGLTESPAASFYQVDVANFSAVETAISAVLKAHGKVDILVNNAGITRDGLFMKMKEEDWDRVLDVNLKSCYNTCQLLSRSMIKARRGRIINITSVIGLVGNAGQANYAASKAGMIGFSKSLARELARRNINVNCVAPGFIDTHMTKVMTEEQQGQTLAQIPMGRMGEASEIAHAVLFLASEEASYITGQVLTVDGGMVMV